MELTSKKVENQRNVAIQLLRVSACAMVFLVHFGQRTGLRGIVGLFTNFGAYGVHLFLLISGFLAGKTFYGNPKANVLEYYKKRMIAILPLYYLVIGYYFITENLLNRVMPVIPPDELNLGWFRYLFLLNGFFNSATYFWSNLGITWTIPIFAFFYLVAPWLLRKSNSVRYNVAVLIAVFAVCKVLRYFYTCSVLSYLYLPFMGAVLYACVKNKVAPLAIVFCALAATGMTVLGNRDYTYVCLFGCIILALASAEHLRLPDWLQRVVDVLDSYSYTLYLVHGVVFCSFLDRMLQFGVPVSVIATTAILGTAAGTWLVGRFVEKPLQKFLKKKFLKH